MSRWKVYPRVFRYCAQCPDCTTVPPGVRICEVKREQGHDNIGIHVASDGTAINCPR